MSKQEVKVKTVSNEDNDPASRNPMLYDPLQESSSRTSTKMQYVAALVICIGAVSAGTGLAWTSPVLPQIEIPKNTTNSTNTSNTTVIIPQMNQSTISSTPLPVIPSSTPSTTDLRLTESEGNKTNIRNKRSTSMQDNQTMKLSNITAPVSTLNGTSKTTLNKTHDTTPNTLLDITSNTTSNTTHDSTDLKITEDEASWVGSFLAIGAFCGAVPSGYIADTIGRKYTAMLMGIPFIISWISIIYAQSAAWLFFGRFMVGVSTGSFCVIAPMYISEIAETSIRGKLGTLFQLGLTVGILFTYCLGAIVSWRTLSTICLFLPICMVIGMFFLPDTPTYLLKKGRRGDAALSLKWLWGKYCDSRSAIQLIQNDLDSASGDASVMDLFTTKANRKGLLISLALQFFQQFSGINAVIFYTVPIFKSAGSTMDAALCSIIVGIVQVIMTFASGLLIERSGRKILLLFSSSVMAICLAILGTYFKLKDGGHDVSNIGWIPLLSVVMFIVVFSVGYGPIPWLMMGELFLPDVKGAAVSLSVMFNWCGVFVITKSFGILIANWGSALTFWFFAAFMVLASVFVSMFVFETKGKSATQIQMQLAGEK